MDGMRRRSPLISNLAWILDREGHNAEAKKLDPEELDIRRRILGPEHPDMLRSMNNPADTPAHESHDGEAEQLQREALVIKQPVLVIDCDRLLEHGACTHGGVEIATSGQFQGKTLGLKGLDDADGNHAKIGVSTSGSHHYTIFGDINQQGAIKGNCKSSQNGRVACSL
jgi:hypothetical protein